MDSINRQTVEERVGLVFDTMAGAQLTSKGIRSYVKAMREVVGVEEEVKSQTNEFIKDFGKGI
jgi:hypothetical protein